MSVPPPEGTGQAVVGGPETGSAWKWAEATYWQLAAVAVAIALPLAFTRGTRADMAASVGVALGTAIAWIALRRSFAWSAALHLTSMHLSALSYAFVPASSPQRAGLALTGPLLLQIVGTLGMTLLWGARGGAVAVVLAGGGIAVASITQGADAVFAVFATVAAVATGTISRQLAHELQRRANRAAHREHADPLTGLANRRYFYGVVRKALAPGSGPPAPFAILYVALNRFGAVNDTLGRSVGDEALRAVAKRLSEAVGENATVARLGGDEFAILLSGMSGSDAATTLAQDLVHRLRASLLVRGHVIVVGARVGVAYYPDHGMDVDSLVRSAAAGSSRARHGGRSVDALSMQGVSRVGEALRLEVDLRRALQGSQLMVYLQPVHGTSDGRVVGAEALVRWNHPSRGLMNPAQFVPIAEEAGLISEVDQFVFETVVQLMRRWQWSGWHGWLAVNLAASSFSDPCLPRRIGSTLADSGIDASRLVLEVTESQAMLHPEASISVLHELKRIGVRLALDDFGIGYSSLAYLKAFPIDHVKLDRSFINGIGVDERDESLLEAVVTLARKRKIEVVAEGVETERQLLWLRELRCEYVQGFWYSRPMPVADFEALLMPELRPAAGET